MENIANLKFEMKFLQVYGEHNTICFAKQVSFTVQIIIWNQAKKKFAHCIQQMVPVTSKTNL